MHRYAGGLLVLALLPACGDMPEGPVSNIELPAELATIQTHVFDPACVGCHNTASPGGGLDLSDASMSYAQLVDVGASNPIAAANGWRRVKPGDPELSFLMRKIENPGIGEGAPMPVDSDQQLSSYWRGLIQTWIENGASR